MDAIRKSKSLTHLTLLLTERGDADELFPFIQSWKQMAPSSQLQLQLSLYGLSDQSVLDALFCFALLQMGS